MFHYFSVSSYLQVFIKILSKGYVVQIRERHSRMSSFLFLHLLDQAVSSASFSLDWQMMRCGFCLRKILIFILFLYFLLTWTAILGIQGSPFTLAKWRGEVAFLIFWESCVWHVRNHIHIWTCLSMDSSEVCFCIVGPPTNLMGRENC